MAVSEKKYHVGLGPGDVGDYVLVPGDPFRTPLVARHLEGAREVAFSREYRTFTGKVDGVPVSTMSTGMGGPSVAIGVGELHELGGHALRRGGAQRRCARAGAGCTRGREYGRTTHSAAREAPRSRAAPC